MCRRHQLFDRLVLVIVFVALTCSSTVECQVANPPATHTRAELHRQIIERDLLAAIHRALSTTGFGSGLTSPSSTSSSSGSSGLPADSSSWIPTMPASLQRFCTGFRRVGVDLAAKDAATSVHVTIPHVTTEMWAASPCGTATRAMLLKQQQATSFSDSALHAAAPVVRVLLGEANAPGKCVNPIRDAIAAGADRPMDAEKLDCLRRITLALKVVGEAMLSTRLEAFLSEP